MTTTSIPHPLPAAVPQSEIASVYRRVASIYDLWAVLTESRARRRCVELAALRDGEALLEVAVGTGLAFSELAARNPGGRNVGIDLTDAMLERARRRAPARLPRRDVRSPGEQLHV